MWMLNANVISVGQCNAGLLGVVWQLRQKKESNEKSRMEEKEGGG